MQTAIINESDCCNYKIERIVLDDSTTHYYVWVRCAEKRSWSCVKCRNSDAADALFEAILAAVE